MFIKDGLGNSFFQYAYARYLQYLYEQEGQKEKIAINSYYIDHFDFRKASLHNFVLNDDVEFMKKKKQKNDMEIFKIRTLLANGFVLYLGKYLRLPNHSERKNSLSVLNMVCIIHIDLKRSSRPFLHEKRINMFLAFFKGRQTLLPLKRL